MFIGLDSHLAFIQSNYMSLNVVRIQGCCFHWTTTKCNFRIESDILQSYKEDVIMFSVSSMSTIHLVPPAHMHTHCSRVLHTHIAICTHAHRPEQNLNSQPSPSLLTLNLIDALFWSRACLVLRVPLECQERRQVACLSLNFRIKAVTLRPLSSHSPREAR